MHHLEQLAPDLVRDLRSASPELQSKAGLLACSLSIELSGLRNERVDQIIQRFREGRNVPNESRLFLETVVHDLDEKYFELQDSGDESSDVYFRYARAASSLLFACGESPFSSAVEAIYEASMSVDDKAVIFSKVADLL